MAKKRAKSVKQQKADNGLRKKGAYPYYLLSSSLKLGEVVWQSGGDRVGVPKSVAAAALDSDQGSAFAQLVASAKCYGIVEGYTELTLTDLGRDYFMPTSDTAKRTAELSFVRQPPVYEFLIGKFDGSTLPGPSIIANLLGREFGIPKSWNGRVAQTFVTIAGETGILDQSGRLRYAANLHTTGSVRPEPTGQDETTEEENVPLAANTERYVEPMRGDVFYGNRDAAAQVREVATRRPVIIADTNVWVFNDGSERLRLETPKNMSYATWERLKKYVDVMEPTKGTKEDAQMVVSPERPE